MKPARYWRGPLTGVKRLAVRWPARGPCDIPATSQRHQKERSEPWSSRSRAELTRGTRSRREPPRPGWSGLGIWSWPWSVGSPRPPWRPPRPSRRPGPVGPRAGPGGAAPGPQLKVDREVPTDGLLATFTIRSDFGVFTAQGPGMLATRVGEVHALQVLKETEKSEVFGKALAASAKRTGKSIATAVANPVETVKALPEGVGRFFERVGRSVKTGARKARNWPPPRPAKAPRAATRWPPTSGERPETPAQRDRPGRLPAAGGQGPRGRSLHHQPGADQEAQRVRLGGVRRRVRARRRAGHRPGGTWPSRSPGPGSATWCTT